MKLIQRTFEKEFGGKKDKAYDYKAALRERLIGYRNEAESVVRVDRPTNLPRARTLGYKAKEGFVIVRVRIRKGSGAHVRPNAGRRPKRMGVKRLTRHQSIQAIAEARAAKKYPNCEVLNSYYVGEDGQKKYFEVILVDVSHPVIIADKNLEWITFPVHKGRANRGLTAKGKKSRGHHKKGTGTEKTRPSKRAAQKKKNK